MNQLDGHPRRGQIYETINGNIFKTKRINANNIIWRISKMEKSSETLGKLMDPRGECFVNGGNTNTM